MQTIKEEFVMLIWATLGHCCYSESSGVLSWPNSSRRHKSCSVGVTPPLQMQLLGHHHNVGILIHHDASV